MPNIAIEKYAEFLMYGSNSRGVPWYQRSMVKDNSIGNDPVSLDNMISLHHHISHVITSMILKQLNSIVSENIITPSFY